jgi:hypothetical protein
VRAQIGGELENSGQHLTLVMLVERMRIIDQANAWSMGSHGQYLSGLRHLSRFQSVFGVPILDATTLLCPPRSPSIGMMGAKQHYCYAIKAPVGRHSQNSDRILFQTARLVLRSAGAHFYAWDRQIAHPDRALRDSQQRRIMLMDGVSPSDELDYTFMMTGMAKRMGDHSKPPIALTFRQVLWVMLLLDTRWFLECGTSTGRREIAAAAVAHLVLAWLGLQATPGDGILKLTRPGRGARPSHGWVSPQALASFFRKPRRTALKRRIL